MLSIKQRQMNLNFLNYNTGGVDGIEGSKTKSAYKNFQKDFNLTIDGIYGKNTDSKLISIIMDIQNKIGSKADGIAGEDTKAKLKVFQQNNGLAVDGICGILTRSKIFNSDISWEDIKNFKKEEFTCKCGCGLNNIDLRLVKILDDIRDHYNSPLIITSGCRCEKNNRSAGGVSSSRHLIGKASDFYVKNIDTNKLLEYTKSLVSNGTLRYTYTNSQNMNGVVHIDIN